MHSMISQIGDLISSASSVFDDLEANIGNVKLGAVEASQDIEQSNRYLMQKRQRMCCIFCCMVVAMVIIVLYLSVSSR